MGKSKVLGQKRRVLAREESFPISVSAVETDGMNNNNCGHSLNEART